MRPGLDVDLRHDPVDLHAGDETRELVAGAGEHIGFAVRGGKRDCAVRERGSGDRGGAPLGGQQALVDPATYGVVAHTEQSRGFGDAVRGHVAQATTADAGLFNEYLRICSSRGADRLHVTGRA